MKSHFKKNDPVTWGLTRIIECHGIGLQQWQPGNMSENNCRSSLFATLWSDDTMKVIFQIVILFFSCWHDSLSSMKMWLGWRQKSFCRTSASSCMLRLRTQMQIWITYVVFFYLCRWTIVQHCLKCVYSVNSLWSSVALWWHRYVFAGLPSINEFQSMYFVKEIALWLEILKFIRICVLEKKLKFHKFVFEVTFHRLAALMSTLAKVMACCLTARNHVDFSLVGFCGIHLRANLHRVLQLLFCKERYLEHFLWNCPQVNATKPHMINQSCFG